MDKKEKCEFSNQWSTSNISWTSKAEVKEKDERNNQWTSTLKKSPEEYSKNCHSENHNKK